jgi:hypothetical protein
MTVVDKARKTMERDHALAMALARSEERARCVRVLARWSAFVSAHGASTETLGVLAKAAIEIISGDEPGLRYTGEPEIRMQTSGGRNEH